PTVIEGKAGIPPAYRAISDRTTLNKFEAAISASCLTMKPPTTAEVGHVRGNHISAQECHAASTKGNDRTLKKGRANSLIIPGLA
ncbi:hypothetical protein U1Q18_031462, partial [Sarracenia purpurea var. burkii]